VFKLSAFTTTTVAEAAVCARLSVTKTNNT